MKKLILETDIGRDPDDLFTLLYLIHAKQFLDFELASIVISPGDKDQVSLVRFVLNTCGINIPIGIPRQNYHRDKMSSGGVHYALMRKYKWEIDQGTHDGDSATIIKDIFDDNCEILIIGPATNIASYLTEFHKGEVLPNKVTFQGGFIPYYLYEPSVVLDKFIGKNYCPSFNPNGDRKAFELVQQNFNNVHYVTKSICHTMEFTPDKAYKAYRHMTLQGYQYLDDISAILYSELANLCFSKHTSKKFHDPTAAVCHLHREVGTWYDGKVVKEEGGWTTIPSDEGYKVLADIDRDKTWNYLKELK